MPNTFKFKNEELHLEFGKYAKGRPAIVVKTSIGEPFCTLTVNMPDVELEDGEFIVKTYSENEDISQALFKTGWFEDTGKRVKTGYVEIPIWMFR